jgi:5'-deoxynucleotidase YfbR-like HD superfamily hydrolase
MKRKNNKKINFWQKILGITQAAGLLKNVQRTGWALKGVEDVESVADHSHRVAFLGMLLSNKFGFDRGKIVEMALIHDLGEGGIGDIKWESGRIVLVPPHAKHRDERKVMRKIFEDLNDDGRKYFDLWREFTYQTTDEARFVKQLDKLEMAIQALEYEESGYPADLFDEFWENVDKYLSGTDLEDFFLELKKTRKKLSVSKKNRNIKKTSY